MGHILYFALTIFVVFFAQDGNAITDEEFEVRNVFCRITIVVEVISSFKGAILTRTYLLMVRHKLHENEKL